MAEIVGNERKICVAIDEGEESMYALLWCLKNVISKNSRDTLVLVHAKPPRPLYSPLDGTGYLFTSDIIASHERYSDDMADCVMEKAKRLCKNSIAKVETRVESGDPRDVICHIVEKLGAHVLVMGTRGYGLIKRAFLGSVSSHCAKNVKCPVLIVKKPKSDAGDY